MQDLEDRDDELSSTHLPIQTTRALFLFCWPLILFYILLLHCIIITIKDKRSSGSHVGLKAFKGWRSGVRSLPLAICIFLLFFRQSSVRACQETIILPHSSACQMARWPDLVVKYWRSTIGRSNACALDQKSQMDQSQMGQPIVIHTPQNQAQFLYFLTFLFILFNYFILFN